MSNRLYKDWSSFFSGMAIEGLLIFWILGAGASSCLSFDSSNWVEKSTFSTAYFFSIIRVFSFGDSIFLIIEIIIILCLGSGAWVPWSFTSIWFDFSSNSGVADLSILINLIILLLWGAICTILTLFYSLILSTDNLIASFIASCSFFASSSCLNVAFLSSSI